MNAAARLISQNVLSRQRLVSLFLNKSQIVLMALLFAVVLSALSVVYATSTTRGLHASLQQTLADRQRMHIQWGQLLLEKSTRTTPVRIQQIAENKLEMVVPDNKSVVIVNE